MKAVEVMGLLPGPTQPRASIPCDEALYQEMIVLGALGYLEGHGKRGEVEHVFTGRLTEEGAARLNELRRRERGDA